MSKILALDLGDQWVGIAITDASRFFARPLETVKFSELEPHLSKLLEKENIDLVVIGNPITMKGLKSLQTEKIQAYKKELERKFDKVKFILWDERLSSKRAESVRSSKTKDEKIKSHSIASAFILDSYLSYLKFQSSMNE
jgi:putative holliday junction resolvase